MSMERDSLTGRVIGCAIEVHRNLGPGLLESAYEECLRCELTLTGIEWKSQVALPVKYKGAELDCGYRIDLLIAESLIVELKAVEKIRPIYQAQTLTYMKLTRIHTGLLINFNVMRLVDGIKRLKI